MNGNGHTDRTHPLPARWGEKRRTPLIVWMLTAAVLGLVSPVCGLAALYLFGSPLAVAGPTPTPIIWTPTPLPPPTATLPPPTETEEPTSTVSPDIAIGRYVRVAGTGGYGLSLRAGPGENYARMDVALEGEVFIVVDGPTVSGGAAWWKIRDRENAHQEWWAVSNFLEPVERP